MSYLHPSIEQILQKNRRSMNETRTLIRKLKTDAPILSTIVDYGGNASVEEILYMDEVDRQPRVYNNFEKLLLCNGSGFGEEQHRSKRNLSFMDYKAEPSKIRQLQKKSERSSHEGSMRNLLVIEMPEQLKSMKDQIRNLPSVSNSRFSTLLSSSNGSRLLQSSKKSESKRYQTQQSEPIPKNKLLEHKQKYIKSIKDILSEFQSPSIKCNSFILDRHNACKKIIEEQEALSQQYKRFQSLGAPPQKIISLNNKLESFEKVISNNLDSELAYEISHMDSKRFDLVLKHQEEARKMNLAKFQQRKKKDRIQESKNALVESEKASAIGFKLNSMGKQIYTTKGRSPK